MKTMIVKLLIVLASVLTVCHGIELRGTQNPMSYARFPKWNACVNASISFDFKTTRSAVLLMYTDDGGRNDFFQVNLTPEGAVRVLLNIVDGFEGHIHLQLGSFLNDGQWHTVKIQRNRMETELQVDGQTTQKTAFGSDFYFGDIKTNADVYFGGIPPIDLYKLAVPTIRYTAQAFKGSMRNIIYQNCTFIPIRAHYIDYVNASPEPAEACEDDRRNPCSDGCICISTDDGPACRCSELPKAK
ncbi:unnamed protein product, partial [Owenia fusiformis]